MTSKAVCSHLYNSPMKALPLTVTQAALELGISGRRVRELIATGRLRARLTGRGYRMRPEDLDAVRVRRPVGRPRNENGDQAGRSLSRPVPEPTGS